jgi:3-deoxy-D-manno-octulosonic-acid transferase
MMSGLYFFVIRIYILLLKISTGFSEKAHLWVEGRVDWKAKLSAAIPKDKEVCWIHCASLGEFEQGRPVIEAIRQENPEIFILLTFFSPSGYEVRKKYPLVNFVAYLPPDLPNDIDAFIDIVHPKLVIFVKYEFWFGYLTELHRRKIPTLLISSRFRPEQHFFSWYGTWFKNQLNHFTHIHVQDQASSNLLKKIGFTSVTVSGDTRYDRVTDNAVSPAPLPEIEAWLHGRKCLIAGSIWAADDPLMLPWMEKEWALIVAPHEVHDSRLGMLDDASGVYSVRYSDLDTDPQGRKNVLIIDNIGMLLSIYKLGQIAYVGGGFGKGLHNILEPAACGLPVLFGPHHKKFPEAAALEKAGGGKSVKDVKSFRKAFKEFSDPEELARVSENCRKFVSELTGAKNSIMDSVRLYLNTK